MKVHRSATDGRLGRVLEAQLAGDLVEARALGDGGLGAELEGGARDGGDVHRRQHPRARRCGLLRVEACRLSLRRLRGWLDVARADTGMAPPDGLLAALVELELCSLAPLGFAGSSFSTWANLIGARRWAAAASMAVGDERRRAPAYVDLHTGASVPTCAANGGLASEFRNRSVG